MTENTPHLTKQETGKKSGITVLIAFILVCLNLRIIFGGVSPLLHYMNLNPVVASILMALPPLCMGLFSPLGAVAGRRFGEERALFLSVLILTIGILVRSWTIPGLLTGTVIASVGIAGLNVLTPVFIRQNFNPARIGVMMGVYAAMMGAGGGIMAGIAVPIYTILGQSWPLALGVAAIPSVIALLALLPLLGEKHKLVDTGIAARPWHWLVTHPTAWSLIGFFGIQCLVFYVMLAWLPEIYIAKGATPPMAGFYLALSIFAVAFGGFFGPTFAARKTDQRLHILASIALCLVGLAGMLLTPASAGPIWCIILGFGMGAGQGIPGVLYAKRSADHSQMTQLSGMVQTFGYIIAATGPIIANVLHHWIGSWAAALEFLIALSVLNLFISLRGGKDHVIDG